MSNQVVVGDYLNNQVRLYTPDGKVVKSFYRPDNVGQPYSIGVDPRNGDIYVPELADGISFVAVAMGLFGLGEIIVNLEREGGAARVIGRITSLWPTREDWKRMLTPILRGTVLGSLLGMTGPRAGTSLALQIKNSCSVDQD